MSAFLAKVGAKFGAWIAAAGALLAVFFTVYLRGQAAAKADAKQRQDAQRARDSEKRVDNVLKTVETVAEVRRDIAVTPGAAGNEVARNVGEALKEQPTSLQGRLGQMARDKNKGVK